MLSAICWPLTNDSKSPLKSAYPSAPRFSPLGYLDCKLRMEEDGTNHLVAVELRDEHTKVTR